MMALKSSSSRFMPASSMTTTAAATQTLPIFGLPLQPENRGERDDHRRVLESCLRNSVRICHATAQNQRIASFAMDLLSPPAAAAAPRLACTTQAAHPFSPTSLSSLPLTSLREERVCLRAAAAIQNSHCKTAQRPVNMCSLIFSSFAFLP